MGLRILIGCKHLLVARHPLKGRGKEHSSPVCNDDSHVIRGAYDGHHLRGGNSWDVLGGESCTAMEMGMGMWMRGEKAKMEGYGNGVCMDPSFKKNGDRDGDGLPWGMEIEMGMEDQKCAYETIHGPY